MIQLSDIQLAELKKLQKSTVEENLDLEIVLNEICYINPTEEYPWGRNNNIENYVEAMTNFNSYNKYLDLLKKLNIK